VNISDCAAAVKAGMPKNTDEKSDVNNCTNTSGQSIGILSRCQNNQGERQFG